MGAGRQPHRRVPSRLSRLRRCLPQRLNGVARRRQPLLVRARFGSPPGIYRAALTVDGSVHRNAPEGVAWEKRNHLKTSKV